MNSENETITLKVEVRYGWDEEKTSSEDALYNAVGLAVNPDFSNVVDGTYLNGVIIKDTEGNIITEF